jgi:GNAT superfamily N-acetyltransferase
MTTLRDGCVADAEDLVAIHRAAALAAYADVFPPDRYPYPRSHVLAALRDRLAGGFEAIVAEDGGEIVGFAVVGESMLEQLYVRPDRWRTGVGSLLHDAAVDRRRCAGDERLRLWTLEANTRARGFYERRGWRLDGATKTAAHPPYPIDVGYMLQLTG